MVVIAFSYHTCFFKYIYQSKRESIYSSSNLCSLLIMIRKLIAFIICSIGVLLPWRLRCLYIEVLGWITQFFYFSYFFILKFIINELEKAKFKKNKNGQ